MSAGDAEQGGQAVDDALPTSASLFLDLLPLRVVPTSAPLVEQISQFGAAVHVVGFPVLKGERHKNQRGAGHGVGQEGAPLVR